MNRAWAASLSNLWHSTNWPMWLAIAAAIVVVAILIVVALRSEGSFPKGAVIFVAVVGIGIAAFAFMTRSPGASVQTASSSAGSAPAPSDRRAAANIQAVAMPAPQVASLPALSCLDGIAGESVEGACEKALFASADATAAAVSYAAAQITRLSGFGTAASADKVMTPELRALRRTIERDRYGLVAQVLMSRDGCTSSACPFFDSLTNTVQVTGNMNERLYDGLVGRYSPFWNAPTASAQPQPVAASSPQGPAPGRPMSGDFPSAASIPPVNIMTPEPSAQGTQSAPRQADNTSGSARPASAPAAKKSTAQKSRAQAPTSLAPAHADDDN